MEKEKKPIYKKWWFWLAAVVVIVGGFGSLGKKSEVNRMTTQDKATSLLVEASSAIKQTEMDDTEASKVVEGTPAEVTTEQNLIDIFIDKFNANGDVQLVLKEVFTPSDKNSGHYRTEFRLNAYKNAIGKSFEYGNVIVDIVLTKSIFRDETIRIYMDGATLEQCKEMLLKAGPIMDKTATDDDIQNAVEYISERKEANGYYFANLGLGLLRSTSKGYEFMLKMRND